MKNTILIIASIVFCTINIYGQKEQKLINKGKKQLTIAYRKMDKPKKQDKALEKAYTSYTEAAKLNEKIVIDSAFAADVATLKSLVLKKTVDNFENAKKLKDSALYLLSASGFEKAIYLEELQINLPDTSKGKGLLHYYSGVCFQKAKHLQKAIGEYQFCIDDNYEPANAYVALASVYADQNNLKLQLAKLDEAHEKFPDSENILAGLINYHLKKGNNDKTLIYLDKVIESNPKNASYYFAKGTIYDNKFSTNRETVHGDASLFEELAIENYSKAIELKPDFVDVYYNLGATYYNKAAYILQEANDLPLNQIDVYNELIEESNDYFKLALPNFEYAHALNRKDKYTIQALTVVYKKLKMFEKQEIAKQLLDGNTEVSLPVKNPIDKK